MGKEIPWSFQKIRSGEQLNLKGRGFTNVASLTAAGITPAKNPGAIIHEKRGRGERRRESKGRRGSRPSP